MNENKNHFFLAKVPFVTFLVCILFLVCIFFGNNFLAKAEATVPSPVYLAPCPSCSVTPTVYQASPSNAPVSTNPQPSTTSSYPSTTSSYPSTSQSPNPSSSPCQTSQLSVNSQSSGSVQTYDWGHRGGGGGHRGNKWHASTGNGYLQQIIQFLLQLLQLLFKQLGINLPISTTPCTTASPSSSPSSGGGTSPSGYPTAGQPSTGGGSSGGGGGGSAGSATTGPTTQPGTTSSPTGTTTAVKPYGSIPGTWSLKFDDEFNGTSVDTSKWNVEGPTAPNNSQEEDCYAPGAVSENGGNLNITISNTSCSVGGTSYKYTGGQLDTGGKETFTYGYYEARINNPGSGGQISNWPAWWLVGLQACWPTDGEIDIFEGFNGNAGYHYGYGSSCNNATWQGSQTSGQNMTGWHVYAVDWQQGSIKYYYDGTLVDTITQGVSSSAMQLMLDNTTAPQGDVGGPIVVPTTMQVDYVRVWQ